jgi:hypothetical protein
MCVEYVYYNLKELQRAKRQNFCGKEAIKFAERGTLPLKSGDSSKRHFVSRR